MSTKKITILSLLFSLLFLGCGLVLENSTELSLCAVSEPSCIDNLTRIGDGLLYGMSALAFVFFLLLFLPSAFPAWKKFAVWFIPIAALFFIFYTDPGSGDYFSPYPVQVFKWVSVLYVVLSVIIISLNSLKTKNNLL